MISKHEPVALRISSTVPRSLPPARTRAPPAAGGKIHTGERWRNLRVFFFFKTNLLTSGSRFQWEICTLSDDGDDKRLAM